MERLISKGKKNFEKTEDFKSKKRQLIKKISLKYLILRENEKNVLKKFFLHFKEQNEIKIALRELNPLENLFIEE